MTLEHAASLNATLSHCLSLAKTLKSIYGPLSSDKLIVRRSPFGQRGASEGSSSGHVTTSTTSTTITNDGATLIRLLTQSRSSPNPIHLFLASIAQSQEMASGDGTTSVVLLACFLLEEFVGMESRLLGGMASSSLNRRQQLKGQLVESMNRIVVLLLKYAMVKEEHQVFGNVGELLDHHNNDVPTTSDTPQTKSHQLIRNWIQTTLQSKILRNDADWISEHLIIPIVKHFREMSRQSTSIHMSHSHFKKSNIHFLPISGQGGVRMSTWTRGIVFKRGLKFAGHEQQQKSIVSPKILLTSDEIEWKHMKENVKLNFDPTTYEEMLEFEWGQCKKKMDSVLASGANVIVSSKSIGDIATQYFARHGIVNIGMVEASTVERLSRNLNVPIVTSLLDLDQTAGDDHDLMDTVEGNCKSESVGMTPKSITSPTAKVLATCSTFKELEIQGGDWYCLFDGIPNAQDVTITLHASSKEILHESLRCFDDIFGVTECLLNSSSYTFGGGFLEMHLSTVLKMWSERALGNVEDPKSESDSLPKELGQKFTHIDSLCIESLSKALRRIVETLCENAGYPTRETIRGLEKIHQANISLLGSQLHHDESTTESVIYAGVSPFSPPIQDMRHVIEPCAVKEGYIVRGVQAAASLFCAYVRFQQDINTSGGQSLTESAHQRYENYKKLVRASKNASK
mmetsp:Transcript_8367/g.30947  ORF Transcript_8367/g.30947 Transcript_8367/m.30947 type:complete len:684 (-) Transcript_8367:22-2073(-)